MRQFSTSVTDASLVEQARSGSTAAFEELVRRHFRAAYAVALSILGNQMDAEDVCHEGFLKALDRLDDCRDSDRFAAWLLQIVRNRARNYRAYRKVRDVIPLEFTAAMSKSDSTREAEQGELREFLQGALAKLTEVQREVVLLHDMEGWKHREIAQALGISEVSARQHLFVARKQLRESLGPQVVKEYLP
jgi:RNA polymerase sigma-70 factor (ECF subfamily)